MTSPDDPSPPAASPSAYVVASRSLPTPTKGKRKPPKTLEDTVATPATTAHKSKTPPQGAYDMGMKDPAVIRWHLENNPDRMSDIYGSFNWRAVLAAFPASPDMDA